MKEDKGNLVKDQSEKPIGREQRKFIQNQKVIQYPNSLAKALLPLLPARKNDDIQGLPAPHLEKRRGILRNSKLTEKCKLPVPLDSFHISENVNVKADRS